MDEKKPKKPSSRKRGRPPKAKKSPSPKPAKKKTASKKKATSKKDNTFNMAALSAVLAANQAKHRKEGEGIKFMSEYMQEYLSNYILIGYTMEGNPVHITYAPTQKDYDCLSTGLQRYILDNGPTGFGP